MVDVTKEGDSVDIGFMDAPFHVNWNYTSLCNFACQHCYSRLDDSSFELTSTQKKTVAANLIRSRVFSVNLGGGEPLLCPDVLDIVSYLASNKLNVILSSNGWEADEQTARRLKVAGLRSIVLSLDNHDASIHDAFRKREGSFTQVMKAIALYRNQDIPVTISTTITSKNVDTLEDIIHLVEDMDCAGVEFKRIRLAGNARGQIALQLSKDQEKDLYQGMAIWKQHCRLSLNLVYSVSPILGIDAGCPCGRTSLAILSNGDIAPCVYSPQVIGNALEDDIDVLWCTSPQLAHVRKHFTCYGLNGAL